MCRGSSGGGITESDLGRTQSVNGEMAQGVFCRVSHLWDYPVMIIGHELKRATFQDSCKRRNCCIARGRKSNGHRSFISLICRSPPAIPMH